MKKTDVEIEKFGDDFLLILNGQGNGFTRGRIPAMLISREQVRALRDNIDTLLRG